MTRKIPKKYQDTPVEDLLAILNKTAKKDKPPGEETLSSVEQFLLDRNIRHGDDRVKPELLWFNYLKYGDGKTNRRQFFIEIYRLFKDRRAGEDYLLDVSTVDTSPALIKEMFQHQREAYAKSKESKRRNKAYEEKLKRTGGISWSCPRRASKKPVGTD